MINLKNRHLLVMGVSGSGKTTLAQALADHFDLILVEGDDFHPPSNIEKMSSGIPLNDADRLPWLQAINCYLLSSEKSCVIACSALKSSYRNILNEGSLNILTIFLEGSFQAIYNRISMREGHFMPSALLQSQFDTLEEPGDCIKVNVLSSTEEQVSHIQNQLEIIEKNQMNKEEIGLVGLGVMGKSLARNLASNGIKVAIYNAPLAGEENVTKSFSQEFKELNFIPCEILEDMMMSLERPRKVLLMIKAGDPIDQMIDQLIPLMEEGDSIIDGGNSFYKDTLRRIDRCKHDGIHFVGMGVSGGESGALNGPSIMPSGDDSIRPLLLPILERIAAVADDHPCVRWMGKGASGHFVKMIHNGIEYADMQLLSETYSILKNEMGKDNEEVADILESWKSTHHNSYLLDITINILRKQENGSFVLDEILDVAGHKGTGLWTSREALEMGVPVPTIQSAMNQRILSSLKSLREKRGRDHNGNTLNLDIKTLEEGILFCRMIALIEGLHLILTADQNYKWDISISDVLSVWRGGCIIRSDMLIPFKKAFSEAPDVNNPLEIDSIYSLVSALYMSVSQLNKELSHSHLSFPAIHAAVDYYRSITTDYLPINMIQAQRDYFGAHTYRRLDDRQISYHTQWE